MKKSDRDYHASSGYWHITIIDAIHLNIQKRTMLPIHWVTTTLLFFFLPFGISIEEILNLSWGSTIRIMDLNLNVHLFGCHGSFQETSSIRLVVVAVLVIRMDRKIVPTLDSSPIYKHTCFVNGFIKLSKSYCISFSTIDHLELIPVLHNRSYRSYMSKEMRDNYFVMPQRLRQPQQIQKEVSYVSDKSKVKWNTISKNWEKKSKHGNISKKCHIQTT